MFVYVLKVRFIFSVCVSDMFYIFGFVLGFAVLHFRPCFHHRVSLFYQGVSVSIDLL